MMQRRDRAIAWVLVMVLALPGLAVAAKRGRLIGKVIDPEGQPVAGVKVIATCDQVSRYRDEDTTDEKGLFKLDFDYLSVVYQLRFEKDGYLPLESRQEWDLQGVAQQEFTLYPGQQSLVGGPVASTSNMAIYKFNKGVDAFNSGDYPTAEAEFSAALEHDSQMSQAWVALSAVRLKQEHYQEAAEAAEKAIELGTTDQTVFRTRWEAYRHLGDEAKAAQALSELQDAEVRATEAKKIHNEGVALAKAGDTEAAFAKFQEALAIDPNLMSSLVGLATTAIKIGKNEEAARAAERILSVEPSNEAALRIRYNAAIELGDPTLLVDALVGLAAVEPKVARDGLLALAFEAYDANDLTLAATRFEKLLLIDPSDAKCHYYLGLIYVNEGANDKAKSHLEQFIQQAPDDPDAQSATDLLAYLNKG